MSELTAWRISTVLLAIGCILIAITPSRTKPTIIKVEPVIVVKMPDSINLKGAVVFTTYQDVMKAKAEVKGKQ